MVLSLKRWKSRTPPGFVAATIVPPWTIHDVSQYLQVPMQTLYSWRARGVGPRSRRVGKHLRYEPADVVGWFKALNDGGAA